jgi:hypothetical protein
MNIAIKSGCSWIDVGWGNNGLKLVLLCLSRETSRFSFPISDTVCVVAADCPEERGYILRVVTIKIEAVLGVDQRAGSRGGMAHSSVAGGVKGNKICLSSGVLSTDAETVDIEAENPFSLFIARLVMTFVVVLHY